MANHIVDISKEVRPILGHDTQEKKDQEQISLLRRIAESEIMNYLRLDNKYTKSGTKIDLFSTSYDEYFDTEDQQTMIFLPTSILPITTLTAVTENGVALTENTDYVLNYNTGSLTKKPTTTTSSAVLRSGILTDYWYPAQRAVRVQWTAGFVASTGSTNTMPNAIKGAVLKYIRMMYYDKDVDIKSRSSAGISYTKEDSNGGLPNNITSALQQYRMLS